MLSISRTRRNEVDRTFCDAIKKKASNNTVQAFELSTKKPIKQGNVA